MRRVKRKKIRLSRVILALLLIYLLIYLFGDVFKTKLTNINILGNELYENFLSDQKVMELAGIDNYPNCFLTSASSIKRKLLGNPYIKDVKVKRKWFCRMDITIERNKILFQKRSDNKIVLENGEEILSDYKFNQIPILINYVPKTEYKKLIKEMKLINEPILARVSEIEYDPNEVDKERFLLSMTDGNYVYLTLYRYDQLNYYLKILPELEGKKGIFYWDLGNYFKIIE